MTSDNTKDANVEWGPEIEVGGVRPAWLQPTQRVSNKYHGSWHHEEVGAKADWLNWDVVEAIRLPANHPHYRTEKPAEAPLGVLTGVERLERYEGFLRRLAGGLVGNAEAVAEAKALLPVDPDLLKAREIVAGLYEAGDNVSAEHRADWAKYCRDGAYDDELAVRAALAGIKAGREMGK